MYKKLWCCMYCEHYSLSFIFSLLFMSNIKTTSLSFNTMTCPINPLIPHAAYLHGERPLTICPMCGDDLLVDSDLAETGTSSTAKATTSATANVARTVNSTELTASSPVDLATSTAQLIADPRAAIAAVLKATIGSGKEVRKANSVIGGAAKVKAKIPWRPTTLQTNVTPTPPPPPPEPTPALVKLFHLLLKIAHRPSYIEDGVEAGVFINHTKNRVFSLTLNAVREFTVAMFTGACVDSCKKQWPGDRWSTTYLNTFPDDDFKERSTDEWKVYTGHLSPDDNEGANLVPVPKWPLEDMISTTLSLADIIAISPFIEDTPSVTGKGKAKALATLQQQVQQFRFTIVLEWLVPPREESVELGEFREASSDDDDAYAYLYRQNYSPPPEAQVPIEQANITIDTAPTASSSTAIAPPPATTTLEPAATASSSSTRSHRRGISATTTRSEREEEEVVVRSRRGRVLRPTKKD
jgi:hypothetical protein